MADMKPPSPRSQPVSLEEMQEIARQAAGVSREDMAGRKKVLQAEKKAPKHIPAGNAKKWLDKIERSRKVRKEFEEDRARFLRMYAGDYSDGSASKQKAQKRADRGMSVNIIYSHVEIITPAVFSGFPFIKVRAKTKPGDQPGVVQAAQASATNMELVLNYWMKELAADDELHDAFFDNFFGLCVTELGWETDISEGPDEIDAPEAPAAGEGDSGEPILPAPPLRVRKDGPTLMRRDPDDFFLDPDARRRKEGRWVAAREVILYNDFLDSPRFNEKAKKKVQAKFYPAAKKEDAEAREDRSDKEWVEVYYVWDTDTRKKYAVSPGMDFFLEGDEREGSDWPFDLEYKSDPFPFCVKDAKRDHASPYSWSEFKAYEPQINELNRLRNAIQIHVARSLPRYVHTQALGERDVVKRLMRSRSDESTQVNSLDAIRPLDVAGMPADYYQLANMAKDDLLNISGLFEFQNQSIADTATEASLIEGRSQVRKSMRSKEWEQYVVEVAAKLAQLCQQFMDQPLAVEIAGPEGIQWLEVNKAQIQGEFHFEIEPGIMEYKNEALRKQQLLKFMELTANDPNVNRRSVILSVAKEMELPAEEFIVAEKDMPAPPPPEPTLGFKDIDVTAITDPVVLNSLLMAALTQNQVQVPPEIAARAQGLPPPPPGGPGPAGPGGPGGMAPPVPGPGAIPGSEGKDISGMGANPNGNPSLPPVEGNLMEATTSGGGV